MGYFMREHPKNIMLNVFSMDVYALLDPGASLYFVTPYVSMSFRISPKQILELLSVSTHVGEPILAKRVHHD
ncbi:hypothetical protein H5410_003334, partial [Solanum commersonii]